MIYFNIYFHFSGLSANELLNLAKRSECAVKVSRRDLPAVLSQVSQYFSARFARRSQSGESFKNSVYFCVCILTLVFSSMPFDSYQ